MFNTTLTIFSKCQTLVDGLSPFSTCSTPSVCFVSLSICVFLLPPAWHYQPFQWVVLKREEQICNVTWKDCCSLIGYGSYQSFRGSCYMGRKKLSLPRFRREWPSMGVGTHCTAGKSSKNSSNKQWPEQEKLKLLSNSEPLFHFAYIYFNLAAFLWLLLVTFRSWGLPILLIQRHSLLH